MNAQSDRRREISVEPVEPDYGEGSASGEQGKGFWSLPERVYRGDSRWIPPPAGALERELAAPKVAGRQRLLQARVGQTVVARVVARMSDLMDEGGHPLGLLGAFEALDEPEAVARLLDEGCAWLAEQGCRRAVGPMDRDTWHAHRCNAGPWSHPPFLLEPYNPPSYPSLWCANGFEVLASYSSYRVEDLAAGAEATAKSAEAATAAGYRLRRLRLDDFDVELDRLYELSRRIFQDNFLYTPISRQEFRSLYAAARPLVDPHLVLFAESPEAEPVGFLFAYPNLFAAVRAVRRWPGVLGKLAFLWRRREAREVNFKTLGVLSEHRRSRVGGALLHGLYRAAQAGGFSAANLCLIRDGNPSENFTGGGELLRRYHLYVRKLSP
ncbi:MAG: hypothetical protein SX243_11485 [Acidobacteriota bacterium]|nr:hypothetical protein [Acidobacteriota bacterium]